MANRFVPNPAGMRELSTRAQTAQAMEAIGTAIAQQAMGNGGRFTKEYQVERQTVEGTAGVRVGTAYPFAHWDEWGTIHRAPRAPLRRALGSLGLLTKAKVR